MVPAEAVQRILDGELSGDISDAVHVELTAAAVIWLKGALATAHTDHKAKRRARLLLGVEPFTVNLEWANMAFFRLHADVHAHLAGLGAPLRASYIKYNHAGVLGSLQLPLHRLVAAENAARRADTGAHVKTPLRLDIEGVVPMPPWEWCGLGRAPSERCFMHIVRMLSLALNDGFHVAARGALAPHIVPGEGVMERGRAGEWRLTPPKGWARQNNKRTTDHRKEPGCRPALNIDAVRLIGVAPSPAKMASAAQAVAGRFNGVGRIKNGFSASDAADKFELRTMMLNVVYEPGCTYAELAAQPGVSEVWDEHACSEPEGKEPRGRWRKDAGRALSWLRGESVAACPVRFICEVQLLLEEAYHVRESMHEPYKVWRAESPQDLHADFMKETLKAQSEEKLRADGDSPLKLAARDGNVAAMQQLLPDASAAERDAAFVIACGYGHESVAEIPELCACASAVWGEAWEAATSSRDGMPSRLADILLRGASQQRLGVPRFTATSIDAPVGNDGGTALHAASSCGDTGAVGRLLMAGANIEATTRSGHTALLVACYPGHCDVAAQLLAAGADVNRYNELADVTPLKYAAQQGHDDCVALLLSHGAYPSTCDKSGTSAVYAAAQNGHDDVLLRLVLAGANVNQQRIADGVSPLWVASKEGHDCAVAVLLEAGAETEVMDTEHGRTPLFAACELGRECVVEVLLSGGANRSVLDPRTHFACRRCSSGHFFLKHTAGFPSAVLVPGTERTDSNSRFLRFLGGFAGVQPAQTAEVGANCLYFEVQIVSKGETPQFGWCDSKFTAKSMGGAGGGDGVGDDAHSWGVDGERVMKWSDGGNCIEFGAPWKIGDVVGFSARTAPDGLCELSFSLNGSYSAPMGCAFRINAPLSELRPAFSLGYPTEVILNFAGPFRHGGPSGGAIVSVASALGAGSMELANE
jgi:ankyrin repeat protein